MLDKHIKVTELELELPNIKKEVSIKHFADLHYCSSYDDSKLDLIKANIDISNPDYVCISGDLIDSTNFLVTDRAKRNKLIEWLTSIARERIVFFTLGNHDISYFTSTGFRVEWNEGFLREISDIPGLVILNNKVSYEDEKVNIKGLVLPFKYYYTSNRKEDLQKMLHVLKEQRNRLARLSEDKVNILLCHSPIYTTNKDVLEYIKGFDLILCGHMHNGCIPPVLDEVIKGNRGLISPTKTLFPSNARGIIEKDIDRHKLTIVVNSGIIKLQECAPLFLEKLNCFFPMGMNDININRSKDSKVLVKTSSYYT